MSGFKEAYRLYERLKTSEVQTLEQLAAVLPPDKPYNHLKVLEFALGAYCMNELGLPKIIESNIQFSDKPNSPLVTFKFHRDTDSKLYKVMACLQSPSIDLSKNTNIIAYVLNDQGLFDENIFIDGNLNNDIKKPLLNANYVEIVQQVCGNIFGRAIRAKEEFIRSKILSDWRFALMQDLLIRVDISDHFIVTNLANERNKKTEHILKKLDSWELNKTPWIQQYRSLLLDPKKIVERILHIDLIFNPTADSAQIELIRGKLRRAFATTRTNKRSLMSFLLEGLSSAGRATATSVSHLAQHLFALDQINDPDFLNELMTTCKEKFPYTDQELHTLILEVVSCYQSPHLLHQIELEDLFQAVQIAKSILDKRMEGSPDVCNYILDASEQNFSLTMSLARGLNNFYADKAINDLSDISGFIPALFSKDRKQYNPELMAQYGSKISTQIGCLNIFTGLTQEYLELFRQIINSTAPAVHNAGGKLL